MNAIPQQRGDVNLKERLIRIWPEVRRRWRTVAWVAGAALLYGLAVFFVLKQKPEWLGLAPVRPAFRGRVAPAEGPVVVTALGRLEPETKVVDVAAMPGSRIDRMVVKEGDRVEAAAPLAFLDSHGEMTAARDLARKQLEEARVRYKVETQHRSASVSAAELHVREAQELNEKTVEAQKAVVRSLEAGRDKAKVDFERATRLLSQGVVAQSYYDDASLAARQTQEQLADQQAHLARLTLNWDLQLDVARANLVSAQTGRTAAQLAFQVGSLEESLKLAEARLERTVVRAPFTGEILKVLTRAGETVGQAPVLKMGDTRVMYALAEVYETDAALVRGGQRASVTSKAFPDQVIEGTVERISSIIFKKDVLAVDPTSDVDARVVEARIKLDDSRLAARFNQLQVDVAIHVTR